MESIEAELGNNDIPVENNDTLVENNSMPEESNDIQFHSSEDLQKKYDDLKKSYDTLNREHEDLKKKYASSVFVLQAEIDVMKQNEKMNHFQFEWNYIKKSNRAIRHFTGLPSVEVFEVLHSVFVNVKIYYFLNWEVIEEKISKKNQMVIALMKLKLNPTNFELATWFGCSEQTIRNVFMTWLHVLHKFLFLECMKDVPPREMNLLSLPACFASFPNCRMIIDCTEIQIDVPDRTHSYLYFNYF